VAITNTRRITNLLNSGSVWKNVNGVNGRIFGTGDNIIFLPAANDGRSIDGYRKDAGRYWSSEGLGDSFTFILGFDNNTVTEDCIFNLGESYTVRCVAE
jgi:hypothetical protein